VAESNVHLVERIQANLIIRPQLASQEPPTLKETRDHRLAEMIGKWKDLVTEASNPTETMALLRRRAAVEAQLRDAEAHLAQCKEKQRRQAERNRKIRLATEALRRRRDEKVAELGVATNKRDRVRARKEATQKRLSELQAELQDLVPIAQASRLARREIDLAAKQTEEFDRLTAELEEKF
jgi:lipid II:glycine glycyltransferase (peptidoglycan interpeptide bridge formation enzyme)